MNRIKASYVAVVIGAAAAAVATPIFVRKVAATRPSAQTAPIRMAGAEPDSPPGPPTRVSARPDLSIAARPTLTSPPPISSQTTSSLSDKIDPKPGGANANLEPKMSAAPAPAADPAIERPAFDVVRVDPTGETVVAGHATPKAAVELRDQGRVIAKVDADESGKFVMLPPPLPTGGHRLELAEQNGRAPVVVSDPVTIDVAARKPDIFGHSAIPAQAPATATAVAESERPKSGLRGSPTPQPRTVASADRSAPLPIPAVAAGALAAEKPAPPKREAALTPPATQARPKAPEYVARIQPPAVPPAGEAGPRVSVRTVEAPGLGRLEVTGVAAPNSFLRLYLNGSRIFDTSAGTDRWWSLTIARGMAPGFYTFRAEEIDRSNGAVSARAEVAFSYPPRLYYHPQSRR
jgi:hypothetical protein